MSKLIDIDGAKVIWEHVKKADAEVEKKADTNATAISTETARAKSAESSNATAIANEITRAKTAETANAEAIAKNSDALGGHTIASDVPENAVFTDTVYDDTALTKRVTALEGKEDKNTTYTFSDDKATDSAGKTQAVTVTKVNGHTVNSDVPSGAKFTDTVTKVVTEYGDADETVALSKVAIGNYVQAILDTGDYAIAMPKTYVDLLATSAGISTPIDYSGLKSLASLGTNYADNTNCFNVKSIATFLEILCGQIDTNTSNISSKADSATTLSGYGITNAYTKTETYTKEEVDAAIAAAIAGINTDTFHWDAGERTADTIVWGQGLSTGKYYTNFNANTGGLANGTGGSSVDSSGNVTVNNSTYYGGIFVPFEVTAGKTYKLTCDIPFGLLSWGKLNSLSTTSSGLDSPQTKPTHLVNNWSDSGGTQSFEITPTTPYLYIAFGNSDKKPVTWTNIKFVKK